MIAPLYVIVMNSGQHFHNLVCAWTTIEYISNDFNSLLGLAQQYGLLFAVPLHCVGSLGAQCRYTPFPGSRFQWDVCLVRERYPELTGMASVLWDHLEKAVPGGN